jgi:hypothetical protein
MKNGKMIEPVWGPATEIVYKGKPLLIKTILNETLSNGWMEFGVKCDNETFLQVFGKNPIPLAVKPKQEFKAEYDFFQNTPEQVELVKAIWSLIQQNYFQVHSEE